MNPRPLDPKSSTLPNCATLGYNVLQPSTPQYSYTAHLDFRERSARAAPQERFFLLSLAVYWDTRLAIMRGRRKKNITDICSTHALNQSRPFLSLLPVLASPSHAACKGTMRLRSIHSCRTDVRHLRTSLSKQGVPTAGSIAAVLWGWRSVEDSNL